MVIGRRWSVLRAFVRIPTGCADCSTRLLSVDAEGEEDAERWNGPATNLETREKRGPWTVQASFSQEREDFTNALEETRRGGGIVFGYVASRLRQIVARLGRYDDTHYSMLALA